MRLPRVAKMVINTTSQSVEIPRAIGLGYAQNAGRLGLGIFISGNIDKFTPISLWASPQASTTQSH